MLKGAQFEPPAVEPAAKAAPAYCPSVSAWQAQNDLVDLPTPDDTRGNDIPEEKLRADQILVLQVPNPEPLRPVQPNMSLARQMHADVDCGRIWPQLYEQIVRSGRVMKGASYPSLIHDRHVMTLSPTPRWEVPKLHMARHLTLLPAGREKRIFAVPPFTKVEPFVFSDVPYREEDHGDLTCGRSGIKDFFMNEISQQDGSSAHEVSDSDWGAKAIRPSEGQAVACGET